MKAKTVSVSMPQDLVKKIIKAASENHEKFSEYMKRAAIDRLERAKAAK